MIAKHVTHPRAHRTEKKKSQSTYQITEFVHSQLESDFSVGEAGIVAQYFFTVVQEDLHAEGIL